MSPARAVTDTLIHDLVKATHAEGITAIDVAAAVEDRGRVLLVNDNDFEDHWDLPASQVLAGENLLDALCRSLTTLRLHVAHVTSYLGHHDHAHADDLIRVFCFAVTVSDPQDLCHAAAASHDWADLDDLPDLPATTRSHLIELAAAPPTPQTPNQPLTRPLRAYATGFYPAEAAVELLVHHATWLTRADFVEHFVHINTDTTGAEMADIDWNAALFALDTGKLPCSTSENHMLRLAASLAVGTPTDLRDALTSLDHRNAHLVSEAVLHANGQRPTATSPR